MGKGREHINYELLNNTDYSNIDVLTTLYKQYLDLRALAEEGDTVAHSISLDLQNAFKKLEFEEKRLIKDILVRGLTYREYKDRYGVSLGKISKDLKIALGKVRDFLDEPERK